MRKPKGETSVASSTPFIPGSIPTTRPPKSKTGVARSKRQLIDMQAVLYDLTLSDLVPPHVRAACARAWSDLQERKRVLDGKPLPGQLRPDLAQAKGTKRIGPPARTAVRVLPKPAQPAQAQPPPPIPQEI